MNKKRILSLLVLILVLAVYFGGGLLRQSEPALVQEPASDFTLQLIEDSPAPGEEAAAPEEAVPGEEPSGPLQEETAAPETALDEDGIYTSKEDVALYLYTYGHLPSNFITKKEARALGWEGGSLEPFAPGKCIGGDHFGNYEGRLPEARGRSWQECDINTLGARSRGPERLAWSNDGLIYYTGDHYETWELLYGEP